MKNLHYMKIIAASKDKIWDVLWSEDSYSQWTKPFNPASIIKSDWQIGGKTYFLDGDNNGMVSTISSLNQPNEITFTHLGYVENGIEDLESPHVQKMSGAQEKYYLEDQEQGYVKLIVMVEVDEEWQEMMDNGFNQGLEIVRQLSEKP